MYLKKLQDLLSNSHPFALIRLPKENQVLLVYQNDTGKNTYSFTSFDSSKKYEFTFDEFLKINLSEWNNLSFPLSTQINKEIISKSGYLQLLNKTIKFLQKGNAGKIVISREKWVDKTDIHPVQSFIDLCSKFPNSFCHLSFWNKEEIWLGATPEVLGTFENSIFTTMALAGTLPDTDSMHWEAKETEEQQVVTDYIHKKLNRYTSDVSIQGPETLHVSPVKHLVTYFSARLNQNSDLPNLINELHPTPAVCGIPLQISKDFILKEEGYNRDFYAGYIGIKTQDSEKYFVNLRCGKLFQNGALLFVGGGITAQSNPEKEWEETELKSRFIKESL